MHTELATKFLDSGEAREAAAIIGRCVHCGFCLATCPTYQVLGDERDSPRGRIYLVRQLLEGAPTDATTETHLDRCLGCRACETTCPSGVRYGALLDFARGEIESQRAHRWRELLLRAALLRIVPSRTVFPIALALARALRPLLPRRLRAKIPPHVETRRRAAVEARGSGRQFVVALEACAESAAPATQASLDRVLARSGIDVERVPRAGCCGALAFHLGRHDDGRAAMRRLIDACWPAIERGASAIVIAASGCDATVRDYAHLLRDDPAYAEKAARVSALARDPAEILLAADRRWTAGIGGGRRIAFHAPCSLTHGLRGDARVARVLREAGYELAPVADAHLCCGSAGSYSVLQPTLSSTLRARKLAALTAGGAERIATANIGCQLHLAAASPLPVQHWIELLDAG